MSKPLIHFHDLISHTWRDFRKNWNQSLVLSKWFLFVPLITFVFVLLTKNILALSSTISLLGTLANIVITLWTLIRLMRWTLAKDQGKDLLPAENQLAWQLFFPFLWLCILISLAILGGLVIFFLPGIWLSILFTFSYYIFLERNIRGTQAMAASAALIKDRWWGTFFRLLVAGFLFLILYSTFIMILGVVVGAIAGFAKINVLINLQDIDPLVGSTQVLLQGIGQMIFMPLFVLLEVKLYRSLKETR